MTIHEPLELHPLVSIGPFRFGSTWQSIAAQAGPPESFELDDIMTERRENRAGMVLYYRGPFGSPRQINRLRCIILHRGARVLFRGIDLMNDRNVVDRLSEFDQPLYQENPYMFFGRLGLCLGGFGRLKIKEKKLIMAFARAARGDYQSFASKPF